MERVALKKQLDAAFQYSLTGLALNDYMLREILSEASLLPEDFKACAELLHSLLNRFLDGEEIEEELKGLRERIKRHVEALTDYTTCFSIYEKVFDWLERRYRTLPDTGYEDEQMAELLYRFIFQSDDVMSVNLCVREILGKLPVRFTKQRFFELVKAGMLPYVGGGKRIFEAALDTLRTESMARLPEDMETLYPEYHVLLGKLKAVDFKQLTPEIYEELTSSLEEADEKIEEESGNYTLLAETVNSLYILVLVRQETGVPLVEREPAVLLLRKLPQCFGSGEAAGPAEELDELLVQLEGAEEKAYERYLQRAGLPEGDPGLMDDPSCRRAAQVDWLMSGSLFADLEQAVCTEDGIVDQAFLDQELEKLFAELAGVFSSCPRQVVRAIMAQLLSQLLIQFSGPDELDSYIRGSLSACTDEAEKEACKQALLRLVEDEYALA